MNNRSELNRRYGKYVLQNVFGSLGISCYVIADTFFISKYSGANGITVLNLALPLYGLIYAIGALVGVGSATRYGIDKARGEAGVNRYFSNALLWELLFSVPFILAGAFLPGQVIALMKGDEEIVALGIPYFRVFLCFAPLFMMQHTFTGFIRNDRGTVVAMIATMSGSLFNILFDYVFMFVFDWGLMGAALATGASPVIGILVCQFHLLSRKSTIRFFPLHFSARDLGHSVGLGISAFVGEFANAVTTAVFNFIIIDLTGNVGVAAYGVIANYAVVMTALFSGISNGCQPLLSEYYGGGFHREERSVLKRGVFTALGLAAVITAAAWLFTDPLVSLFNSEGNEILAGYARTGLRIYVPGYLFAGVNVVLVGYFAATEKVKSAMTTSLLRGVVAIVAFAFLLSALFGMMGVWSAFAAAEGTTCLVAWILYFRVRKKGFSN